MNEIKMSNVLKLSVSERIKLVEMIWDSISEFPDAVPLTEEQSKELDIRRENYEKNPGGNVSWEQAKKMILNR
ncbi:MAG: addiction module protein [Ignavibacteria bacterium]|nr:addiction module protein [Ignavibacteria bacterium]